MDTQELLNVIDIIRNEKLYTERMNKMKEQEEALKGAKYVNVTMIQADEARNAAVALKEELEEKINNVEQSIEDAIEDERERLRLDHDTLAAKRKEVAAWAREVAEQKEKLAASQEAVEKHLSDLRTRSDEISKLQADVTERERVLSTKIHNINRIFKSEKGTI